MDAELAAARPKRHFAALPLDVADLLTAAVFVAAAAAYVYFGGLAGARLGSDAPSREIGVMLLLAPVVFSLLAYVLTGCGLQRTLINAGAVGVAGVLCGAWLEMSAESASPVLLPIGLIVVLAAGRRLRAPHAWALWAVLCIMGAWLSVAASVLIVGEFDQFLRNAPLVAGVYALPTALLVRFVRRRALHASSEHPVSRRRWWRLTTSPLVIVALVCAWGLAVAYLSISLLAREIPAQNALDETGRLYRSAQGAAVEMERTLKVAPAGFDEDISEVVLPLARSADMAFYVFSAPDGVKETGARLDLNEARFVGGAHRSLEPEDIDDFRCVRDLDTLDPAVRVELMRPYSAALGILPFDSSGLSVRSAWMAPVAVPLFTQSAVKGERFEDWRWVLVAAPALPYAGMPLSSVEIANGAFAFAFPWLLTMLMLPSAIVLEVLDRREAASARIR